MSRCTCLLALCVATTLWGARLPDAASMPLTHVIAPDNPSPLESLAARKLTATAQSVFRFVLPQTVPQSRVSETGTLEGAIVLGTPASNPLLRGLDLSGLSPEGFLIQAVATPRGRFLALASPSPAGVFHAATYLADFAMQAGSTGIAMQTGTVRRDSPIRLRGTYNLVCWGLTPRYTRQH